MNAFEAGYRTVSRAGHPLTIGLKYPVVQLHRMILYDAIGPGPHSCHWCNSMVEWRPGGRCGPGVLVVDHIDFNPRNNSIENLVPSCAKCNATRGRTLRAKEPRVCQSCGITFVYKVGTGLGKYCSHSCRDEARRAPVVFRICPTCGKSFQSREHKLKHYPNRGVFCSPKCWHRDNRPAEV